MTIEPTREATASAGAQIGADAAVQPRIRIRWGWFFACIALGLAAIVTGWFLVSPASRLGYVGGVLAGIGTTLLLVGVVVLLERRIIDTAVRFVANATKDARARTNAEVRAQIRDFEDRVAAIWETETTAAAADETLRMSEEFTNRVVDAYTDDDGTPSGTPSS
ncbi:hypothetical protein BJY17_002434 [Agromyces hippuratus]|uniref:Uncharacterized protein n=1 Tax=Agromyces hippuratus TaxID=286438 RepID=A0A852WVN0_9MICO|nr:hypothetical protein [Agromyces hippuratus]NYG21687.1 hypothetical protein [Agromyces hippuratus]